MSFEACHQRLLEIIPSEEVERVLTANPMDIDDTFFGFVDTYEALAQLIPKHFTVIDFGAGYNPQSYYFTEHKRFIAVDRGAAVRFQAPGTELLEMDIRDFIENHMEGIGLRTTFAICNYVPDDAAVELARKTFKNVYAFYPAHGDSGFKIWAEV